MDNTALIADIIGQDSTLLKFQLLKKNHDAYGTCRRFYAQNFWRLQYLNVFEGIRTVESKKVNYPAVYYDNKILTGGLKV